MKDHAYFIQGPSGPGAGVLLLPSLWGLTAKFKELADDLADQGLSVLAPDLNFGFHPDTEEEGLARLAEASPDRLASLVLSSLKLIHDQSTPGPVATVGFGMGGSMALWASVRAADFVSATVSFYGVQQIDFAKSRSSYQIHYAENDRFVSDDDAAFMEATMGLEDLDVEVFHYEEATHGFADPDAPHYDPTTAQLAWSRTKEFLGRSLAQ